MDTKLKEIRLQNGKVVHTHFRDYVSEYQPYWGWNSKDDGEEPDGRIAFRLNFADYAEVIDTMAYWRRVRVSGGEEIRLQENFPEELLLKQSGVFLTLEVEHEADKSTRLGRRSPMELVIDDERIILDPIGGDLHSEWKSSYYSVEKATKVYYQISIEMLQMLSTAKCITMKTKAYSETMDEVDVTSFSKNAADYFTILMRLYESGKLDEDTAVSKEMKAKEIREQENIRELEKKKKEEKSAHRAGCILLSIILGVFFLMFMIAIISKMS